MEINFKAIKCVLALMATLLLNACNDTRPSSSVISITIPVLKEYRDQARSLFDSLHPGSQIQAYYKEFDVKLSSHPEIIGSLTINTPSHEKENLSIKDRDILIAHANKLIADCYPEANLKTERDARAFDFIEYKIKQNEEKGITKNYIVIGKDSISLYYHDKRRQRVE